MYGTDLHILKDDVPEVTRGWADGQVVEGSEHGRR